MSTQPPPNPVRLGDLVGTETWVWFYCLDCGHDVFRRPEDVPLAPDVPIYRIAERAVCSA
ncbi:MAG: hypothetical protein MI824_05210 [Hyphomicrobiales bacterium]|nr:hypothetical protein [Hyphomicrobiales bacterium]